MSTTKSITIREFRGMADGSDRLVAQWTLPGRHTRKAARVFSDALDSVRESGLRGHVSVYRDGVRDDCPCIIDGRLE